jgi:hypothetical protein
MTTRKPGFAALLAATALFVGCVATVAVFKLTGA